MTRSLGLLAVALLVLVPSCRTDERLEPAPLTGTTSSGGGASGGGGQGGDGPVVRTVEVRSPWGGPANDLLADGDFELSIPTVGFDSPNAWYVLDKAASAERALRGETGGLCRTGLRCAVLDAKTVLFGQATAPPQGLGLAASMWARPPAGKDCAVISAALVDCEQATFPTPLKAVAPTPDERGWCQYAATLPKSPLRRCLYVDSDLAASELALVDSASIQPLAAAAEASGPPLRSDQSERARRTARRVRDLLPLGNGGRPTPRRAPAVP